LRSGSSKCMTYYFYFIDEQLGLCYLRVPTWCPFRLQFYFNGHDWLANQLKQRGIAYKMLVTTQPRSQQGKLGNKVYPTKQGKARPR